MGIPRVGPAPRDPVMNLGLRRGISALVAVQNEEAVVGLCLASFLLFADEIIIVDNGSTDRSKEICRHFAGRFPDRIRFFDVPELGDLYQNRAYALKQARCQWVVRADADFICYTEGEYDCRRVREALLARWVPPWPVIHSFPFAHVWGDWWHTGPEKPEKPGNQATAAQPGDLPPKSFHPLSPSNARIYRRHPGFVFARKGRREGVPRTRLTRFVKWSRPFFMHCSLKSDMNYLFRSERTNWRETGDFQRYPDLESYLRWAVKEYYGTTDLEEAARIYMSTRFLPHIVPYDPDRYYPYPRIVREVMKAYPIYRVRRENNRIVRDYHGPADPDFLIGLVAGQIPAARRS